MQTDHPVDTTFTGGNKSSNKSLYINNLPTHILAYLLIKNKNTCKLS